MLIRNRGKILFRMKDDKGTFLIVFICIAGSPVAADTCQHNPMLPVASAAGSAVLPPPPRHPPCCGRVWAIRKWHCRPPPWLVTDCRAQCRPPTFRLLQPRQRPPTHAKLLRLLQLFRYFFFTVFRLLFEQKIKLKRIFAAKIAHTRKPCKWILFKAWASKCAEFVN